MQKLKWFAFLILLLLPSHAFAAKLFTQQTPPGKIYVGDTFNLQIKLDTQGEAVNASEIYTTIPSSLTIKNISTAHSIFTYFVNNPENSPNGQLAFIGGIPTPGYTGDNGLVSTVTLKANAAGSFPITFGSNSRVLKNDGQGTETKLYFGANTIVVEKAKSGYIPKTGTPEQPDTTPPHDLSLIIGKSQEEYNNQYFASFSAQDDESGIDHYEIAQTNEKNVANESELTWEKVVSPYILKDQNPNFTIYLKAVDKAGNQATIHKSIKSTIFPYNYTWTLVLMLILVLILFTLVLILIKFRKKNKE